MSNTQIKYRAQDFDFVAYSRSTHTTIDAVREREESKVHTKIKPQDPVTITNQSSIEDLKDKYPDVEVLHWKEAYKHMQNSHLRPPQEITDEQWFDALEALPPARWNNTAGAEIFMMSEYWALNVTNFYVRIDEKYYVTRQSDENSNAQIVAMCKEWAKAN